MNTLNTEQAGAAGTAPDLKVVKAGGPTTPASNAGQRSQTIPRQGRPSLRAAIDAHCRECGACDAGANWREHISCCAVLSCPIWPVRPISRSVPNWLASRERDDLPDGWCKLPFEDALSDLRSAPFGGPRDTDRTSCSGRRAKNGATERICSSAPTSSRLAILKGGA